MISRSFIEGKFEKRGRNAEKEARTSGTSLIGAL